MIYFDNAATTYPKPEQVKRAMLYSLNKYGSNPGRGGHEMSYNTSEKIYETRKTAADFFGIEKAENIIFTKNCTESLNIAIKGLVKKGGHFICSSLDHNAVIRPLEALKNCEVCTYDVAKVQTDDFDTVRNFERLINPQTIAIVCTGASNVFGKMLPVKKIAAMAHRYGKLFILDAAQIAGTVKIDCQNDGIDFLCAAGHKGLYGPMGTGVLAINCTEKLNTLYEGGTGSYSAVLTQPEKYPDRFESGTVNVPGIIALGEGIKFVSDLGINNINKKEKNHIISIYRSLLCMPHIRMYTNTDSALERYVPLLSFNIRGMHSEETASLLAEDDIAVRAGLHCAPLAHETYGTKETGTVRIAPSVFTSEKDVKLLLNSIVKIAKTV